MLWPSKEKAPVGQESIGTETGRLALKYLQNGDESSSSGEVFEKAGTRVCHVVKYLQRRGREFVTW